MDADRFDAMIRTLASPASRRALLGFGLAGALGSLRDRLDAGAKRKKRNKKKNTKRCRAKCAGKVCGPNGCGGSCGDCTAPLICQSGVCACPEGSEACGGECLPRCPTGIGGAVIVRHPGTCQCCIRPAYLNCGEGRQACCGEPDSIPCCGAPCNPLAVYHDCVEASICHYDVECAIGRRCQDSPDPRACQDEHPL